MDDQPKPQLETATFGGGCFWCMEAVFQQVPGVRSVTSGYKGGTVHNPSYEQVTRGDTGHAEVVRIEFDPAIVSYEHLLGLFWKAHDPTQLNRQGADIGSQYRSVVFYHNPAQKAVAEATRDRLDAAGVYDRPIVTEIQPASAFYQAETYHQNYYRNNPNAGYSRAVISPKLEKLGLE